MRGPAAGTALFALALLTAHNHQHGHHPWSTPTDCRLISSSGVSGLALALELDPLLSAYEGSSPTTTAEGAPAAEGPHQHGRCLWSLHVVWDELGRFVARFDPFGHKKHGDAPCNDVAGADKDMQATHTHGSSQRTVVADATSLRANETDAMATINTTDAANVNTTLPNVNDAMLRGRRHHHRLAEPAEADLPTMVEAGPSAEPNRRRKLFSFYVIWDELGRFFARFDPLGHKHHRAQLEPCDDDDKKATHEHLNTAGAVVPDATVHDHEHGSTMGVVVADTTVHDHEQHEHGGTPGTGTVVADATTPQADATTLQADATTLQADATATSNLTTAAVTTTNATTVTAAQLQGRIRQRRRLRESDDTDEATPMAGDDGQHQQPSGLGQRLARTEEVEMLRHEQLWAVPGNKGAAMGQPKKLGEAYERISSESVVFLEPDADNVGEGQEIHQHADGEVADPERRRQLLLHHWHGGRADDVDDDYEDDYDEDDEAPRLAYYSKDGGDWYWQTHGFRHLQEARDGMGVDGADDGVGDPNALMIDTDDPEFPVPSRRRPSPAEVLNMTPEEQVALRERDREALENMLRKASREEEAHRPEPTVAKSLDNVLAMLAVRPPLDLSKVKSDGVKDIPHGRGLQAAAGAGAGGAGGQRAAALVSAVAGSITEQQKAEIRQAVYDAAVSMVREAAREAMQEAGYGGSGSGNNKARAAGGVGRGGGYGSGGNEDAYQAAANAILNVMSRNTNAGPPAVGAVVVEAVEKRAGEAAMAAASRASESRGRAIDTGRGKSLLEAARAAARQSASAGRPPAGYDPYPPHRRHQRRRLRGLKDATFRIPVPFTRDPASNATDPKFIYNASDAVFINLRAREDENGAMEVTAQSMSSEGSGGDAQQIPWPRIGGVGPALNGLGSLAGGSSSNSNSNGADPKGKEASNKHAWANALLKLVHKHQAGEHPASVHAEAHKSRSLEEVPPPPQAPAKEEPTAPAASAPADAKPATEPAKRPTTVGDYLQNALNKDGSAEGSSSAGGGGGGGGLDLNALAGILQRPFVPPVPGAMGTTPGEMQQLPGTVDAYGNTIEQPAQQQPGQGQPAQGPTSMMGEQEQNGEDEKDTAESNEPMGLSDAFYDRAASQLLSHSGSNFKKMQAVVQGIMAEEGFDV